MGIKGRRGIFSQPGDQHEANATRAVNDRLTRGPYDPAGAQGLTRTEARSAGPRLGAATRQGVAYGAIDLMPRDRSDCPGALFAAPPGPFYSGCRIRGAGGLLGAAFQR